MSTRYPHILQALSQIVSNIPLMSRIAAACDREYDRIKGTNYHDPANFESPFDQPKAMMVGKNVAGPFAVIIWVQIYAMVVKGAKTQKQINDEIISVLKEMLAIDDPRGYYTPKQLAERPLNIADAIDLFGLHIGALALANGLWNLTQYLLTDKGPLGRADRANIFSELPLDTLLLDWDQIKVGARELLRLIEGSDLSLATTELAGYPLNPDSPENQPES